MPKTSQPNLSLINGLDVLEAVMAADGPVGSRELGRSLGLDRSVTNRLLLTLASQGMLTRTEAGRYVPGHGVHSLAAISLRSSGLLAKAMPCAERWLQRGCSFTLGVLWRHHFCHLIAARPGVPLASAIGAMPPGDPFVSTAGVALLSHAPATIVTKVRAVWPIDAAVCKQRLEQARRQRSASHTYPDGTLSVGLCVGNPAIAAIAVSQGGWDGADASQALVELRADAATLAST
jgi:DNA-binding IclR family transcriptional regulator